MSKVVLRRIAKFNALKYASDVLFNVDTNVLLEDSVEDDEDLELLSDLLAEEMRKIVIQLSNKADSMPQSGSMPNLVDDILDAPIENNVDIERDYG